MKLFVVSTILLAFFHLNQAGPLRLQKRAAFYIANETACVVDATVYNSGDPIPTDDPCEACRCRPPGFACVLKECESKPGCRAVRRAGQCCPEYICGCEHNGRMYRDGDEIRDSQNPCYTCHCQGSSIACAFVDCFFRVDCAPEYVPGECCPHYPHCDALDNSTSVDYAISTQKPYGSEEATVSPKTSESTPYSEEIPENIAVEQVTKKEYSESPLPEILDPSLLFSINEHNNDQDDQTTKKDISAESVSEAAPEETVLDAESSEESSSEEQVENATELLKTDFEIINDEEKPKEPEVSPEQSSSEVSANPQTSAVTDKNVEIFPVEESTTVEVIFKTDPPAEVTGQTTVSSTTVLPNALEDADDKANELSKRFRSLKNLTSDDEAESPKENVEVKNDESKDASTKEATEKVVTSPVTEKPTVKLEKEIVVEGPKEDIKSSDSTTEVVSKSETLHHNAEDQVASEQVETVTTVVEVKEPTSSEKSDVETSSPDVLNEPDQVIFKALSDVAEENTKHETTLKSNDVTTSQTAVEISDSTSKVEDVSSSSIPPEDDKLEEKVPLYADEIKIVSSSEAPEVTEVESGTTVVAEVSSEKVEPTKE